MSTEKRVTALIDSDAVCYILGWNNRKHQDEKSMELQVDQFMVDIITKTNATHYLGVFSPSKTFRNDLYPAYKANRPEAKDYIKFWKPRIIELCKEKYGFIVADNIEADDVLSLLRDIEGEVIFCSPDKDLKQIPGKHWDYTKQKWEVVSTEEAGYRFWTSMLVGDSTDNIPGCKKVGPVGAKKILEGLSTGKEMGDAVIAKYKETYGDPKAPGLVEYAKHLQLNYALLKLVCPNSGYVVQQPVENLIEYYKTKIQEVTYEETELNIENDGVLQCDQRPHQDDILCSPPGEAQ